jgi:hypothetical protein
MVCGQRSVVLDRSACRVLRFNFSWLVAFDALRDVAAGGAMVSDVTVRRDLTELISSNNTVVRAVQTLVEDVKVNASSLEDLREFVGDLGNAYSSSHPELLVPATKRVRSGPDVSTLVPAPHHNAPLAPPPPPPPTYSPAAAQSAYPAAPPAPTAPQPMYHQPYSAPHAPQPYPAPHVPQPYSAPHVPAHVQPAPPAAAPPTALSFYTPNTISFGPVSWNRNITAEFKNFQLALPGGASLRTKDVRAHSRNGEFICITFPTTADMDRFLQSWGSYRPATYSNVRATKNA